MTRAYAGRMIRRALLQTLAASLASAGGLPPRRPDQPPAQLPAGIPPAPSGSTVVANRVIVFGANDGVFVYSGTPGPGNLIASVTSGSGADLYGNNYQAGITSYLMGTTVYTEILDGLIRFSDTLSQIWTISAVEISSTPYLKILYAGGIQHFVNSSGQDVATQPLSGGTPEVEHSVTSGFPAGWSGNLNYWLLTELGSLVFIDVALTIATTTVVTTGELIFTLPSGYFYAGDNKIFWIQQSGVASPVPIQIDHTGKMTFQGAGFTAAGSVFLYGQVIITTAV